MATRRADRVDLSNQENYVRAKSNIPVVQQKRAVLEDVKNKFANNVQRHATIKQDVLSEKVPLKPHKVPKPKQEPQKVCQKKDEPVPMDISEVDSLAEAFSSKLLPPDVDDVDAGDEKNPQLVSEYVGDIYQYIRQLEVIYPIRARYLDGRKEITGRMRGVLVDWLVQVHWRFQLLQETLYLTVAIIDRFLQECEVGRSKLQLVGVAAMFIASKYEEMYSPEIGDFVYITDNTYTKHDILKMECHILKTLDFNLGRPLPLHFLRRNSKAGNVDNTMHTLAKYLMELTMTEYDMIHYAPSHIAAAALCLSIKLLENAPWNKTLVYYSKYEEALLLPVIYRLCHILENIEKSKIRAVHTKYSDRKLLKISLIPELKSKIVHDFAKQYKVLESTT